MRLHIEKIIAGGQGLARPANGPVVLTRFVLPGEVVEAKEVGTRRGYSEAEPLEILSSAPERVAPRCPVFGVCGGCDFQHIDYPAQLRFKTEIIRESLQRSAIPPPPDGIQPTLPSSSLYGYRYRIRMKLNRAAELGFFRLRSNSIVRIDQCPVATESLNVALRQLLDSGLPAKIASAVREIDLLHSPADDTIHILLIPERGKSLTRQIPGEYSARMPAIHAGWLSTKGGIEQLFGEKTNRSLRQDFPPSVCGTPFSLSWPPGGFSQINAQQNLSLLQLALHMAGEIKGRNVLDLFCGAGNFALPLALAGATITGVELNRESVAWARINAATAGCHDAQFIAADVTEALISAPVKDRQFSLIILDPPRQGLAKGSIILADMGADRILYISCDPATLMRDLARITKRGYRLTGLRPLDMFPQTHHIETVALLEKN